MNPIDLLLGRRIAAREASERASRDSVASRVKVGLGGRAVLVGLE